MRFILIALLIALVLGCEESNLISKQVITDIQTQCDPEYNVNIENNKYKLSANVDKDCVDNIINGIDNTTSLSIIDTTVNKIVNDTISGRSSYSGKIVNIDAAVENTSFKDELDILALSTSNKVLFSIIDRSNILRKYSKNRSYNFTLYISDQGKTSDKSSHLIESYIVEKQDVNMTTVEDVVSSVNSRNNVYNHSVISVKASIIDDNKSVGLLIDTNEENVLFVVSQSLINKRRVYGTKFKVGKTYNITLLIYGIETLENNGYAIMSFYVIQ